jgi:hypothetical protein
MNRSPIASLRPRQYLLLLFGLLLLWPAMINRGPFYFNDTTAYVRSIDAAVFHVTGIASDWTVPIARPQVEPPAASAARPSQAGRPAVATDETKPVLLGRSAYYGALLYLGVVFRSFWIVLLLQAALAAALLLTLLRHFVDPAAERRFAVASAVLFAAIALTPLPFFVCLLMPDLFTGLAIIAAAIVLSGWARERRGVHGLLVATLALAALVHSSNVLILAGIGCVFGLWHLLPTRKRSFRLSPLVPPAILLGCAAVGLGGEALFSTAVTRITGQAPIRPPFLTARFVDDGPGTQYLRTHCQRSALVLCDYVERLPAPSDGFLWDADPRKGVFMAVPPSKQRKLSAEQLPFVVASVTDAPVATATMLTRDFLQQLGKMRLVEFNYNFDERQFFVRRLPKETLLAVQQSRAYQETMVTVPFEIVTLAAVVGALAVFVGMGWRRNRGGTGWIGYAAVGVCGVLVNDVICGCLSTPHDRYQMRVIWVLPAIALVMLIGAYRARAEARAER